ncbi:carbonic anhydrase family protein [Erwinia sp. 9145]|uniref:carbonic anhydrase n=1 Tax=Erwinia sp. 9145 TaxID=1500895 RepID=UPI00054F8ADF|nr:carbonic anhydrase family protein [Erwinia sp. 9145]
MKTKILPLALFLTISSAMADSHPQWGYTGEGAPDNWGKLSQNFATCEKGMNQSPIDIKGAIKGELPPLSLTFHAEKKSIVNNGHTIQLTIQDGDTLMLDGTEFTLQQLHFHAPSENRIDGKTYPLEIHFVHSDSKGELAVIGVMVEEGADNPVMADVLKNLPTKLNEPEAFKEPLALAHLVPGDKSYYRFSGSLTTPPCTEGVRWLIMKESVTASKQQLHTIEKALGLHNNRPVQPLNGRIVIN